VRKRVSQDWTIYKKSAVDRWSRDTLKSLSTEVARLSSTRTLLMKNVSTSSQSSSPERSPKSSLTRMQLAEDLVQLGQQILQVALSQSDSETALSQIAKLLGEAFQVDGCIVTIAAKDLAETAAVGSWYVNAAFPISPRKLLQPLQQLAAAIPAQASLLAIDDLHAPANEVLAEDKNLPPEIKAILLIPIWEQGQLNGAIGLIHYDVYHWDETANLAQQLVTSLAIAIAHLAQAQSVATLQRQVQTADRTKALLNQLTIASRSSMDLNQMLQMAIAGTAQALEVSRGSILFLKYVEPQLRNRVREKLPRAKTTVICEWNQDAAEANNGVVHCSNSEQSFWLSECALCQQVLMNSPHPLAIASQNDLPLGASTSCLAPIFNFAQFPSALILPIESQGTVLGFLVLQHCRDRHWQPEELSLVELVCAQIGTAIIQNQTLRQVQSLVDDRTLQLQRSLEVQSLLYDKTRKHNEQLRHLNQLKDEFLSTMSHELRTPLTSMSLAIRMLRQPGINPERQAKYLDILEQQCDREINLIANLLKLQQLESNQAPLKLETIDLKVKLQALSDAFRQTWTDKGLNIQLDIPKASLLAQTDEESLDRILQELLTNAGKYSHPDTTVVLQVAHQVDLQLNQIVLQLTNTGAGISEEDRKYVFEKFRRGQGVTQQAIQGTGLGLALVKCLVQHLNGNIEVTSNPIEDSAVYETCFTVTLPQSFTR
jgi:signal transduction histidine kinase